MKFLYFIAHFNLSLAILWIIFVYSLVLHFRMCSLWRCRCMMRVEIFKLSSLCSVLYLIWVWVIVVSHNSRSFCDMIRCERSDRGRFSCVSWIRNHLRKSWIVSRGIFSFSAIECWLCFSFFSARMLPFWRFINYLHWIIGACDIAVCLFCFGWCMEIRDNLCAF